VAGCWSFGLNWKEINILGRLKLSRDEVRLMKKFHPKPKFGELPHDNEPPALATQYADVLFKILKLRGINNTEIPNASNAKEGDDLEHILNNDLLGVALHYAITRTYELINALKAQKKVEATVLQVFYKNNNVTQHKVLEDRWDNLRKIYDNSDIGNGFSQTGASFVLALILLESKPYTTKNIDGTTTKVPVEKLTEWTASQLKVKVKANVDMVLPSLMVLMRKKQTRPIFAMAGGVQELARPMNDITNKILKKRQQLSRRITDITILDRKQLQELTYCLYLMSTNLNYVKVRLHFYKNIKGKNDRSVIYALCRVVKSLVPGELNDTMARYALSALVNLIECEKNVVRKKYLKCSTLKENHDLSIRFVITTGFTWACLCPVGVSFWSFLP